MELTRTGMRPVGTVPLEITPGQVMRVRNAAAAVDGQLVTVSHRHADLEHYVVTLNSDTSKLAEKFGLLRAQLMPVVNFDESETLGLALRRKVKKAALRAVSRTLGTIAKGTAAWLLASWRLGGCGEAESGNPNAHSGNTDACGGHAG